MNKSPGTQIQPSGRPAVALALVLGAVALMVARALGASNMVDFSHILVAGRMWGAGLDPYGPDFIAAGSGLLPPDAIRFAYPPNSWLIAVPLAALKTSSALLAWKSLNLFAAGAAAALLVRSAGQLTGSRGLWPACLFVVAAFTSDIMGNALRLGQTSLVMLLGFALLIAGLTEKRRGLQVAGLAVLMLKPQIGLLFLVLLALRRDTRPAAAWALVASAVACLPVLFTFGLEGTMESARNLLLNLQAYGQSPWNFPLHTSGQPHLFALAGIHIPPPAALLGACVTAAWLMRRSPETESSVPSFWLISVAALLGIVPLHAYDFILLFTCLLLLPVLNGAASRNLVLIALILTWSATPLAVMSVSDQPSDGEAWAAVRLKYDLLTAAGLALLAAAVAHVRQATREDAQGVPPAIALAM